MSSKPITHDAPKTLRLVEPLGSCAPIRLLLEDIKNAKSYKAKRIRKGMHIITVMAICLLFIPVAAAIDILYAEPVLNCTKPFTLFRPNPASSNGIVNLFIGERALMRLDPQGVNYNSLLPITGPGMFEVFDTSDGQGIFETVCSSGYGVSVGQSFYGGILRYPLSEIEQLYGFQQGTLRIENTDFNDLNQNGLWEPFEPVITSPAFATVDLNIGSYTTPTNIGPIISVGISQPLQIGNTIVVNTFATPPIGRSIQGIYLQEMPNGTIYALNNFCPPIGTCEVNLTFTVNTEPQTFHVHTLDNASVGHARVFQI